MSRLVSRFLLVTYLLVILVVLLQPKPEIAVGSVSTLTDFLVRVPVLGVWVVGSRVEFVLNVFAFAPISFLGSWAYPRVEWSKWVAWGFIGSVAVELIQGVFLVGRSAQFADIVANTAGSLVGALIAVWVFSRRRTVGRTR